MRGGLPQLRGGLLVQRLVKLEKAPYLEARVASVVGPPDDVEPGSRPIAGQMGNRAQVHQILDRQQGIAWSEGYRGLANRFDGINPGMVDISMSNSIILLKQKHISNFYRWP